MVNAIIGWTGYVGQTITSKFKNAELYNSTNIQDIKNKSFDEVYFCGMPAEKWKINQQPENDLKNTHNLIDILKTITVKRFILISTVDIFDCTISQNEYGNNLATHSYGKHRRLMEEFVESNFLVYNIIRLPGLFGKGLKKNIIYDLIFDNQITNICLESEFQWYNIENIMNDVEYCISKDIKIAQLVSPPISVKEIIERFFPEKIDKAQGTNCAKYCLTTSHNVSGYWNTYENILDDIGKYIKCELLLKNIPCKLAVSNIAWNHNNFNDILKILSANRIKSVEIAPTKIADWSNWSSETISRLKSYDINFVSCQSILFNTSITNIFRDCDKFINHYKVVAEICNNLGITKIVFGSPKARDLGEATEEDAIQLFSKIGDISSKYNVHCCIEPNSKKYGCTWLTNLYDTINFVKKVNHSYIKVNYDLGNYLMEDDEFVWNNENIRLIGHIQISSSFLKPLSELSDENKTKYKHQIQDIINLGYKEYISLEMTETSIYEIMNSINIFLDFLHKIKFFHFI
jgi:sugar phosphate isomerase/epimerase